MWVDFSLLDVEILHLGGPRLLFFPFGRPRRIIGFSGQVIFLLSSAWLCRADDTGSQASSHFNDGHHGPLKVALCLNQRYKTGYSDGYPSLQSPENLVSFFQSPRQRGRTMFDKLR